MSSATHLKDLALSDTGFVFDPYTGATFTTNATGLAILQALREGLGRSAIIERLRERFDVHGDLESGQPLAAPIGTGDQPGDPTPAESPFAALASLKRMPH